MIILASNSWLRRTILEASELQFQVHSKDVDERYIESLHPAATDEQIAVLLALAKAEVVQTDYPDDLVIAADTFAVLPGGERMHKPASAQEAIALCLKQSGKTIRVVTGIAMKYGGKTLTNESITHITYVKFSKKTITRLLGNNSATMRNSGLGFFSDAPGFSLVERFEGSYTGAMGLPMEIIRENIKRLHYSEDQS